MTLALPVQSNYIHYHFQNYTGTKGPFSYPVEQAKKRISQNFLKQYKQELGKINGGITPGYKDIIDLLDDFSSSGSIGSGLIQKLNQLNFGIDDDGNLTSKVRAGAGLASIPKDYSPDIPTAAVNVAKQVEEIMNDMIIALEKSEESALAAALRREFGLVNSNGTKKIDNDLANAYHGYYSDEQLALQSIGVKGHVETLKKHLSSLNQLSQEGIGSELNIYSIIKGINGCLSKIAGTMYEIVVRYGASTCDDVIGNRLEKTESALNKKPNVTVTSDPNLKAEHKGGNKQKGDVSLRWTENNIVWQVDLDIKLRTAKEFLEGKGQQTIKNLHSGATLGLLIVLLRNGDYMIMEKKKVITSLS